MAGRIYTQSELYMGSTWDQVGVDKKGRPKYAHVPLDPGWVDISNKFWHPPSPPPEPKAATNVASTLADSPYGIRRNAQQTQKKNTLASLLKAAPKRERTLPQVGGGSGGGLNINTVG